MSPLLKNLLTLLTQCDTLQGPPAECRIVSRVSAGKPPHQGRGEKLALRRLGKNGERRHLTYGELLELSNRFANLLQELAAATGSRSSHGSSEARG